METYKVTVDEEGTICWYNEQGERHRLNGPAIESVDGTKEWYQNGKRHRLDGPAVESAKGTKAWYIEGKNYTEEEFNNRNKKEMTVAEIEKALCYSIKVVRG